MHPTSGTGKSWILLIAEQDYSNLWGHAYLKTQKC